MTTDDAISLLRKTADAGRVDPLTPNGEWVILTPEELTRFAAAIRAQAIEEAAQTAENTAAGRDAEDIAAAIRNLDKTPDIKEQP